MNTTKFTFLITEVKEELKMQLEIDDQAAQKILNDRYTFFMNDLGRVSKEFIVSKILGREHRGNLNSERILKLRLKSPSCIPFSGIGFNPNKESDKLEQLFSGSDMYGNSYTGW